jgi:hypothetical protein
VIADTGSFQLVIASGANPELWFNREYTFDVEELARFLELLFDVSEDHIFYDRLSSVFKDTENRRSSDKAALHPDLGLKVAAYLSGNRI